MTFTIQQIANSLELIECPNEDELKNEGIIQNYIEKLYLVNNHDAPQCRFCDEFHGKLMKASCGCFLCLRCIYCELPSSKLVGFLLQRRATQRH